MKKTLLILASAVILSLQGCGGGSSGNAVNVGNTGNAGNTGGGNAQDDVSNQISGTAAVGAPIGPGTLSAVDANGVEKSTTLSATGTFSLGVSNLTAPILLKAEGRAGGRTAVEYSVIDTKSRTVVNVTPVSTAIAARVMDDEPEKVFREKTTAKIARLTKDKVDEVNAAVGAELAAARSAAGLTGSGPVDLLNTTFVADKTGLDRLLDLVSVTVQPDRAITIDNKTGAGRVTLAVGQPRDGALGTVAALNTAGIDQLGQRVQSLLASSSTWNPQTAIALFATGFKHEGRGSTDFVSDFEGALGVTMGPAKVYGCYKADSADVCDVAFDVSFPSGGSDSFYMPVIKDSDGNWKFYGDRAPAYTNINAVASRDVSSNGTVDKTGINIYIPVNGAAGSGEDGKIGAQTIHSVKVFPGSTVSSSPIATLTRGVSGCGFLVSAGFCGNFVELNTAQIESLRANSRGGRSMFTVQYLNDGGVEIGKATIYMLSTPLLKSEVASNSNRFGTVTNESYSSFLSATSQSTTPFTLSINSLPAGVVWEDLVGAVYPVDQDVELAGKTSVPVKRGTGLNVLTVTRDKDGRVYWYNRFN